MIVAALLMLLAVVNGQNCGTKFGTDLKTSKLRQLCKKDASCMWSNDSGPGKKKKVCVDRTQVEGIQDCSSIKSETVCPKNDMCVWKAVTGEAASCRNICSKLNGDSYQSKKKKMCRKAHNSHCRWRKDEKACYDIEEMPAECDQILTPTHCRENDKCEWIKVNGDKRGCRKIVQQSQCDAILDRQQCRLFTDNGRTCLWETFPVARCYDDEHNSCQTIYNEEKCNESKSRYNRQCYWNGLGEGVYDDSGKMNSKAGLPVNRCNEFPACESMKSQAQCEANKNMVGGNCYWNPTYQGGPNAGQDTDKKCKEAVCSSFDDKYTCKHFGCYWARVFPGWENNKNNDKEDKKGLRTYQCKDP